MLSLSYSLSAMGENQKIIFVCIGNSCRSQIAEGFARQFSQEQSLSIEIHSGGTQPAGAVNPAAIEVMNERGIDISDQTSDQVIPEALLDFDAVITMGCSDKDICPANFGGFSEDWAIEDPIDQPIEKFREIRDQIEAKVKVLLKRLL